MRNFSKIFLLLIGINFINSSIKNDEKTYNKISKYYEILIANHILEKVFNFPNNCRYQPVLICTIKFLKSFNNLNNMVKGIYDKRL